MYLLIPKWAASMRTKAIHLHSIMYLLIREIDKTTYINQINLHSIMYLLIPNGTAYISYGNILFTFHNVSINSSHEDIRKVKAYIYIP